MKTKRIKRKKIKVKNVLIFLIIIVIISIISFFIYEKIIDTNIKNIYINGNNNIKDIEIIRTAGIEKYPKISKISTNKITNKIKKIELVKKVKVIKGLFGKLIINIEEYNPLFYDSKTDKIILDNNTLIDNIHIDNLPTLDTDNINDTKLMNKLIEKYKDIDDDIKNRISEIKYTPNSVDNERFLCIMNDGNYVYITLVKIEEINYYLKILPTLDNKRGVLNLDYGNNFEIIE